MEEKIIEIGKDLARSNWVDYVDFDEDEGLTLVDALTIIVMESSEDEDELESDKVYDFIKSKLK